MNLITRTLLPALLMLCMVSFAHAKRVALVMGNDNYTAVTKLQKAGNDADAMARELRAAGFTVQLQKNLNYRSMVKVVESFANGITGGDEVVVFFAGHGVQIRSGSYLLPIDIEADSESQVEKTAYGLNDLTEKLSEAKAAFALVVIDACRDNPLKTKGRSIGATRGLSAVEPAKGQMIVYSASRGQQALDRLSDRDPSPNGVFTREFIARMKKPGVRIEDMVREVQDAVETLAKTVSHEQRPALYNEARGNFYFYGPTTVQVAPQSNAVPEMTQAQKEEKFWDDAKAAGNKEAYEAYLESYPAGRYLSLAKANIAKLSPLQAAPQPTVVAPLVNPSLAQGDETTQRVYRLATEKNDANAQVNLGTRYANGSGGLQKDDVEAARLFKLSAAQGNAQGQIWLGTFYRDGRGGLQKDDVEAARLYKLAADQGNAYGQASLGLFYESGRGGLAKDNAQALRLYRLAAEKGNVNAQNRLKAMESAQAVSNVPNLSNPIPKIVDSITGVVSGFIGNFSGTEAKDCSDCPEMVVIPAGSFEMGGTGSDETPVHRVTLRSFSMGKTEVTQGQWRAVMGDNPSNFKTCGDNCPVENVSWEDAKMFLNKLSAKTGKIYRLPTEAEWEYACRAGGLDEYCGSGRVDDVGWYTLNSRNSTRSVRGKQANAWALHDMSGNALEWTEDCWNENYSGAPTEGNAWSTGNCSQRVVRGGSWENGRQYLRSANRRGFTATFRSFVLGFRVARDN